MVTIMRIRLIALSCLAVVLAACSALPSSAAGGPAAAEPPAPATAAPQIATAEGAQQEAAAKIMAAADTKCLQIVDAFMAEPSAADLAELAERAGRAESGWAVDGGPWADDQLFIGTFADAAKAYGGDAVATDGGGWVVTERDGKPLAIELFPISLKDGRIVWYYGDQISPGDCDGNSAP
jgi:hypothetical protein